MSKNLLQGEKLSKTVEKALLSVDRINYCRDLDNAYEDSPQSIGHGVTISAPHMHAYCLHHLKDYLIPGNNAFDCGSGSGYLLGAMKTMVGDGTVCGMEYIEPLVPWSIDNLKKDGFLLDASLQVVAGDASKGWTPDPSLKFHAIHVGAAAPSIPKMLVECLAKPGRLVIPIGPQSKTQYLTAVDKDEDGKLSSTELLPVMYVPFHMNSEN